MPSNAWTPLANTTLGSTASSVTFSSIAGTYRDLVLVIYFAGTETQPAIRFNSDTGSNYSYVGMAGKGWAPTVYSVSGTTTAGVLNFTADANWNNAHIVNIFDYSATDKHKTYLSRGNHIGGSLTSVDAFAGRWANTSAITSLTVTSIGYTANYAIGSTFALYGVSA